MRSLACVILAAAFIACSGEGVANSAQLPLEPVKEKATGSVATGGIAHMYIPKRKGGGQLFLAVERSEGQDGIRTVLTAERQGRCHVDSSGFGSCPILWEVQRDIPLDAFEIDVTLDTASLNVSLKKRLLRIRWSGIGEVSSSTGNGNALVQQRKARAVGRWGVLRWAWPDDYTSRNAGRGSLYRRVEE